MQDDPAALDGLSKRLQDRRAELRRLVQERCRHARVRSRPARRCPIHRLPMHGRGGGVMRGLQRWTSNKLGAGGEHPGDRVHRGDLERDISHREQAAGPVSRSANMLLPAPAAPTRYTLWPPAARTLERPLRGRLAGDVDQVRSWIIVVEFRARLGGWQRRTGTLEPTKHMGQAVRRAHVDGIVLNVASAAFADGTTTRQTPARRAAIIAGRTPRTERRQPSETELCDHTTSAIASAATGPPQP